MKISDSYLFGKSLNKPGGWTVSEARGICACAASKKEAARKIPLDKILDVLDRTGRLFADRRGPWRRAAYAHLKETVSFSPEIIEATLDMLAPALGKAELKKRLKLELGVPEALDGCSPVDGYNGLVAALPRGVALHVGAGNVFLGVVDSLVMGLLTKNVNIVKTAASGSRFAVLFSEALKACDTEKILCGNIAVLRWKGGDAEFERVMLQGCDAVLVWGGEQAVASYKKLAPAHVRVAAFGPKISFAVVTEQGLAEKGMERVARDMAHDTCLWDQAACACPQALYFAIPDRKKARAALKEFLKAAPAAFEREQKLLPQGRLSPDEMVEITKARELAKVDAAAGRAAFASSFPRTHWTVIAEDNPVLKPSPLNRILYVKAAASIEDVRRNALHYGKFLQTVGFCGSFEERKLAVLAFGAAGAARITRLGRMLEAPPGSPHDGGYPLRELVNFVGAEGAAKPADKIIELAAFAREKTAFYKKRFRGFPVIRGTADFSKLPLLDKNDILASTPPESKAMFSAEPGNGVYFASGGSTGSPKYIFYEFSEYEKVARTLARCFTGPGLGPGDRAANLFVAGNFWSSFITVEKALAYTGAVSVPLSNTLPMDSILKYLEEFKVTALIGMPSFLLKVAESAQAASPRPKIPLRYIFYGGEHAGPAAAAYFRKVFPGVQLKSAGYATVDAGPIGFQCPHCKKGEHHLFSDSQYLEILDPSGKPVKKGAVGELVTTPLDKRFMPVLRFKLGDLGRWLDGACPCGAPEPRFELLGRCDDRIHLGGAHIFISDLENALATVEGLSLNFQAELSVRGHRDHLLLRAERKVGCKIPQEKLAKELLASIKRNCEDLNYVLVHHWIDDPEIVILEQGGIGRLSRTGKIKKVLDLRHAA